ncbi:MAG TPA: hypothetical protein VKZ53_06720 [Candidatus Angelobacter sp.]|nr:hypothetical protein [Candidatus Angelobacter sp.]
MPRDSKDVGSRMSTYADAITGFSCAQALAFCFALGSNDFVDHIIQAGCFLPVVIIFAYLLYILIVHKCHQTEDLLLGALTSFDADKVVKRIRQWRLALVAMGGLGDLAALLMTYHGRSVVLFTLK